MAATVTGPGGRDFRLTSDGFELALAGGQLRLGRPGEAGGIVFSQLGPAGLNLLDQVRQRSICEVAGSTQVELRGVQPAADFTITLDAGEGGVFHWRVALQLHAAGGPERVRSLAGQPELALVPPAPVEVYVQQAPMATGLVYLYAPQLDSTLFYLQDLTALNGYFAATHTRPMGDTFPVPLPGLPAGIVGYKDGAFGLALPGSAPALPAGRPIIISDGYLALGGGRPRDESEVALRFLAALATIYWRIERPATMLVDWHALAQRTLTDLLDPRNWTSLAGLPCLRAYVNDERQSPELITQLDVLTSLRDYVVRYGPDPTSRELDRRLSATLPHFYHGQARTMLNRPGGARPVADSWYFVSALADLARLAGQGDDDARRLVFASVERAVEIARRYHYVFPIFVDPIHGTHPEQPRLHPPREYDVAGAYAYLMLALHALSGQTRYAYEAEAAAQALGGHGFDLAYETHMTALAAAACARLYRLTGDGAYLDLSLLPIANLLRHAWLWQCQYGHAVNYRSFFGLLPMTYATVITPKEQYETWQALVEYLRLAHGAIPEAVEGLLGEFCRHSLNTMRSAFAPLLAPEAVAAQPANQRYVKRLAPELYIPLEDIRDGWCQSGNLGQELYGAGMALTFAAQASTELQPGLVVEAEYPMVTYGPETFTLCGSPEHEVAVRVSGPIRAVVTEAGPVAAAASPAGLSFRARGGTTYRLQTA